MAIEVSVVAKKFCLQVRNWLVTFRQA